MRVFINLIKVIFKCKHINTHAMLRRQNAYRADTT